MGHPDYLRKYEIETVETEIINIHGKRDGIEDDVPELQELVVASYSFSREEWRRSRVYAWMTAFLHFDKILQIPFIIAHELIGISYRDLISGFVNADRKQYPMIGEIRDFFMAEAEGIQNGGAEYTYSEEWLGIYWPADEYIFIKLTTDKTIDVFYDEAKQLLFNIAGGDIAQNSLLQEAVTINRQLIHQPFMPDDLEVTLKSDLIGFYDNVRRGVRSPLRTEETTVLIDRSKRSYNDLQTWCQEVVWWGNKKGAYLYPNNVLTKQLAGHY